MAPPIHKSIQNALEDIERTENVRIVYAVESGSRAWGFESTDSDYDVRFLYVRPLDWYLSINVESRPDTIERPISESLDLSGWDIRKALKLYRKSNPPLLEWLQSPIVYRETGRFAAELRKRLPTQYSPKACAYHYLHMAQGNFREFLRGEVVWRKKYFYVLRPLLAVEWIARGLGPVPMEFSKLVEAVVDDPSVRKAIDELVAQKRAAAEMDRGPRIPVLSEYIEKSLETIEEQAAAIVPARNLKDDLDDLFRATVQSEA